ncbi:MAG: hypothetical protein C4320_08565, partial [Armatimonadota bacterium]
MPNMSSRTRRTILDQSDAREMFDALLLHWGTANIAAQAAHQRPIVLAGNYGRNAFLNDAVAFDHLGDEIAQAGREREAAAEELTRLKVGMRGALESLSHFVHGHFAGADLSRKFPALPDVRSAQERVMNAMTRANEVWAEINHLPASAFEGPLVLNDGTTQREFAAGLRLLERA